MMKSVAFLLFLSVVIFGCAEDNSKAAYPIQQISGRDEGIKKNSAYHRSPIYRAKVPSNWKRKDPDPSESIVDTTKPLCEFIIDDGNGERVRITVHNFPSESSEERIPPNAQVARWKRQFTDLDLTTLSLKPQAYGGFSGVLFEGSGTLADEPVTMMAWTMQLAQEHYSALSFHLSLSRSPEERHSLKQMRADYTIKAVGPRTLMIKHHRDIVAFGHSFELIQEIPLSL